jgi:hypothetical protein
MAQNGEMLGTIDDNGRIRTLRGHGPSLVAIAGHDRQISQRKRMRRTLVTRYVILAPAMSFVYSLYIFEFQLL